MVLKEKEKQAIKDLQTLEQACIDKYDKYAVQAKDPVLQELFTTLKGNEQKVLTGTVPSCNCNDSDGRDYDPKATYSQLGQSQDKKNDAFLATDCITSEKLASSEYNSDVFIFGDSTIRKLLADIQVEEQNHAEMLFKYKTVNGMA